jgi:hypothetical protein
MAIQWCVVCGRGADRAWNNTFTIGATTYVGCDFHSLPEVICSAQNLTKTPGPGDVTNQDPSVQESSGA